MSIAWVRKAYSVPAKRGGRVEYTGETTPQLGTICGASGGHLSIRLDSVKHSLPFHPTWELRYLDGDECRSCSGRGVSDNQPEGCSDCNGTGRDRTAPSLSDDRGVSI